MVGIRVEGMKKTLEVVRKQAELSDERKELFLKKLADEFRVSLRVHFNSNWSLYIDNPSPILVGVEREGDGYAVYAQGDQVAFIEFGAGVFYNGSGANYKLGRPPEISGIGEYGKGKGSQPLWGYYDKNGMTYNGKPFVHLTHGNPPANAFYHASVDTRRKIKDIAREVFK